MSKKLYLVLALLIVFAMPACSRSASSSPVATSTKIPQGTPGTQVTSSSATDDPMALVKLFATQTAMASGNQGAMGTPMATGQVLPGGTAITPMGSPVVTSQVPPTGVPTTPAIVTPYPTTTVPTSYTLQAGEHPYCIARRFDIDPEELLTLNNLDENDLFPEGLLLQIPQTGNKFPGERALHTHPTSYVVKLNDTIYNVSCYFGDVDPLAIAAVNHLVSPYKLTVGQSINIP